MIRYFMLILTASSALSAPQIELLVIEGPAKSVAHLINACNDKSKESPLLDTAVMKMLSTPGVKTIYSEKKTVDLGRFKKTFEDLKPGPKAPPTDEPDLVPKNVGVYGELQIEEDRSLGTASFRISFNFLTLLQEKYSTLVRRAATTFTIVKNRWSLVAGWKNGNTTIVVLTKYIAKVEGDKSIKTPTDNTTLWLDVLAPNKKENDRFDSLTAAQSRKLARDLHSKSKSLQSAFITFSPLIKASISSLTDAALPIPKQGHFYRSFTGFRAEINSHGSSKEHPVLHKLKIDVDWSSTREHQRAVKDYKFVHDVKKEDQTPLFLEPTTVERRTEGSLILLVTNAGTMSTEEKPAELRNFSNSDSSKSFEASFIKYDSASGKVTLRKSNGQVVSFSIGMLHADDQKYIKERK